MAREKAVEVASMRHITDTVTTAQAMLMLLVERLAYPEVFVITGLIYVLG